MLLSPPPPGTAAAGMGRMTLDVIIRPGQPLCAQAGGTCGNVLANLAFLGWHAIPIGRLGDDDAGRIFRGDMRRSGADVSLLGTGGAATPVVVHDVGRHEFRQSCPFCGRRLPEVTPLPLADLPALPAVRVFFFDEDSPAALLAAPRCHERGAIVVYEPNYLGPEVDLAGALAVCDVVKYAADVGQASRPDIVRSQAWRPDLRAIETHGRDGLRYLDSAGWHALSAFPIPIVRDAAGAGDWTTAGFIHGLIQGASIPDALRLGVAFGVHACSFEGARGNTHAITRERLVSDVRRILAGEYFDPGEGLAPNLPVAGRFCVCRLHSTDSKTGHHAEPP